MPRTVGKWWGPVCKDNIWQETEVDIIAYDDRNLLVGECKYRTKAVGLKELEDLKLKAQFMSAGSRELYYLLASKSGFTEEIRSFQDPRVILIDQI
jgi:hypothetical protein